MEEAQSNRMSWVKVLRWVGLGVAGAALSAVVGWFTPLANPIRNWTLDAMRELTAPLPAAFADGQYGVLVADFAGDSSDRQQTRRLYEALEAQFPEQGLIRLERLPRVIRILGEHSGSRDAAEARAREFLAASNAELVIWGESRADNAELVIRYTGRTATGGEFFRSFTDQTIRSELAGTLAPTIAATLIAGASQSYDGEQFPEPNLDNAIERMEELLASEPEWLTNRLRSELAHVLGVLQFRKGHTTGSRSALLHSAAAFRMSITSASRENQLAIWAGSQDGLGNALSVLGENEPTNANLHAAIEAFREALSARTPETTPFYWATTQMNLGITLTSLAVRTQQPLLFRDSIQAFEQAESAITATTHPELWARLQNNFAQTLRKLAEHSGQIEPLREAVRRFRDAARVAEQTESRFVWAAAQRNLGVALTLMGQATRDPSALRDAVIAINNAIDATPRQTAPSLWASTQRSLSHAHLAIAELEPAAANLTLAADALNQALLVFTEQQHPGDWAWTQNDWGLLLEITGDRTSGEAARQAYGQSAMRFEAAYRAMARVGSPPELQMIENNYQRVMLKARNI